MGPQPMRAIMESRCPGSVTWGQEKEPVLQPAYNTPSTFTTVAWERLSEGNFPRAVALLFACCLPHPMSDPFTTCKHLPFRAASGEFCVEVRVGLSQHRIAAPLCSGTKCSIQGPERPVIRPLFHKRED